MAVAEIPSETMCFACGKNNPIGLHIDFRVADGICTAEFTPNENHLSWEDTVYGGIIYSALDDVTGNIPYAQGLVVLRGEACLKSDNELIAECTASFLVEK